MARRKELSKKQLAIIDDLFSDQFDEKSILAKHKVSRGVYNKWLCNPAFSAEIAHRIDFARLQSDLIIAKYTTLAAAKLVQLTESEKEETARKACLDIISLPKPAAKTAQQGEESEPMQEEPEPELSPETRSKLLTVLAETEKKSN